MVALAPIHTFFQSQLEQNNLLLAHPYDLMRRFRKVVYSIKKPKMILLDVDSTLLDTYGNQEGKGFNFHYQSHGYHRWSATMASRVIC